MLLRTLTVSSLSMVLLALAALPGADDPPAPEGQVVLFKLHAEGVQIYECKAKGTDTRVEWLEWVLKGPEAVLTDDKGAKVGTHHAGPTWEASDGSKVVAELPPVETTPKPPAVPWLLLKAKSTEGDGKFSKVTYVRRVDTEGGAAPPGRPDFAYKGDELRVPYKATYIFYGAK